MPEDQTMTVIRRFNEAFLRHDPALLTELVADDCVIENTGPAPEGARYEGKQACLALWSQIATAPDSEFEPEEVRLAADRAIIRWRLRWGSGPAEWVRGVNLMRLRRGLIVEAMGYVKG
jgi:ketosteroid isomerase-like protein